MGARGALIRDWRERLAADETLGQSAAPRYAWLHRARARIYRLLLAMYGRGDWQADQDATGLEALPTPPAATLPPFAGDSSLSAERWRGVGKPPKSLGEIRNTLKAVRSAATPLAPGNDYANSKLACASEGNCRWTYVLRSSDFAIRTRAKEILRSKQIPVIVRGPHILVPEDFREQALESFEADSRRNAVRCQREIKTSYWGGLLAFVILAEIIASGVASYAVGQKYGYASPVYWRQMSGLAVGCIALTVVLAVVYGCNARAAAHASRPLAIGHNQATSPPAD